MQKFINQFLAVILSITCTTAPVSARDNAGLGRTTRGWNEEASPGEIETEPEVTENEEMVSAEEDTPEEQVSEETEAVEEEALPEETASPEETIVPEETEVPEETVIPATEEESVEETVEVTEDNSDTRATAIIAQPEDVKAAPNTNAVFSVEVNGEANSFQWQMSADNGRRWINLSKKTYGESSSITVKAHQSYDGYLYRVVVKVRGGKNLVSEAAKLTVRSTDVFNAEAADGTSIKVDAPVGAFPDGTEMVVGGITEEKAEDYSKDVLAALDGKNVTAIHTYDISFDNEEGEQEPSAPVSVTINFDEPLGKADGYAVVHIKDDGTTEVIENAVITATSATFKASEFSIYTVNEYTIRESEVKFVEDGIRYIDFNPQSLRNATPSSGSKDAIASGNVADNVPQFDEYTFKNATINVDGSDVEIIQIGAFRHYFYQVDDKDTTETTDDEPIEKVEYKVYYRTQESLASSDLIVLVAGEDVISLNYDTTPFKITYVVNYNGNSYTIGKDTLPAELSDLIFTGRDYVAAGQEYLNAVSVNIPRGFEGNLNINGDVYELGNEPTYSLSGDNKTITRNSDLAGELQLSGVYSLNNVNEDLTVTLDLEKRTSYVYDVSWFLQTVYCGGVNGKYGDISVEPNNGTNDTHSRINGSGWVTKTISEDAYSDEWTFTTQNRKNHEWLLDALEINGINLAIPYSNGNGNVNVSKTTELPSGTIVTVTLKTITGTQSSNKQRTYTVSVENAYENIVITGGNIYDASETIEIIPEVLENVTFDFYGYAKDDDHNNRPGTAAWQQNWGVSQPISSNTGSYTSAAYNMYRWTENMRFKLAPGYVNPEIAFVSSTEVDLRTIRSGGWYYNMIQGIDLGNKKSDNYYPVTSSPNSAGYYVFKLGDSNYNPGDAGYKLTLLRIRASLAKYGVKYAAGTVSGATVPAYDDGGDDGSGALRGYNVVNNDVIALAKKAPVDPNGDYVFLYYTVDGGDQSIHYAPGQKVDLADVLPYASKTENSYGEYEITFTAHWQKKELAPTVIVKASFILDDDYEHVETYDIPVPVGSSVYVDIDSETMTEYMERLNWQAFYDEVKSTPYINEIEAGKDYTVELKVYSKFYIYHSSTGKLELHTTKEMEKYDEASKKYYIDKLDITKYVPENALYGGYYKDYAGAYEDQQFGDISQNVVQKAMEENNDSGTLTPQDIKKLSDGGFVEINEGVLGTTYVVNDQAGFWRGDDAYTENGMQMKPERAEIYYLKEVPEYFLNNYYQVVYNKSSKKLTGLYIMSAVDDTNYNETGFVLETPTKATVVESLEFRNQSAGTSINIAPNVAFYYKEITGEEYDGYLTFWKASGDYFSAGAEYTVHPYWTTLDGIRECGHHIRTVRIAEMTKSGISKTDVDKTPETHSREYAG